jgi:hypothetical protein
MGRKKKTDKEPTMPFGKYKGVALTSVLREEPSYLCWFMETVEGCMDVKKAISELPGFREEWEKYYVRKHRKELTTRKLVEETVRRMFGVEGPAGSEQPPDAEQIDDLCDRLFNQPVPADAARLEIVQGRHYGKYVQSGENLDCAKAGDEQYRFQVCDQGPPCRTYEPWVVTPETDLSGVPSEVLQEMDYQMSYCGECDDDESRETKFSRTRKHIQRAISQRMPS